MAVPHVLLFGGYGKVAQLLTPLLLQRSWNVTSIIRNPEQIAPLEKLGSGGSGKLTVLVRSIEDIKSEAQAKAVIDEVKPDYVVWSAGAGGKGPPERKPSWVNEAEWQQYLVASRNPLQRYYEAKLVADEELYAARKKRNDFAGISLRPAHFTSEPAGKVSLGKLSQADGFSSRASVAQLTALLLESNAKSCWLDMLDGDEDPEVAVKRCVEEGVDAVEGEPFCS
ncbi:hypothetical protein SLS62_004970 [Diatrype stigma]|uniref:NAD(P)-binding domain-containing protein n=1 Tax=Diatrype stigma TaxID=117547 RepID=A0AAN9YQ15_9PEZI